MPGQWKPIHENHAIDVMAAVLTFSEPIPIRLLSRVLKLSEDAAFAAGLRSRHSMTGVQFMIGPRGASAGANVPVTDDAEITGSCPGRESRVANIRTAAGRPKRRDLSDMELRLMGLAD